jgi:hypothetical protein
MRILRAADRKASPWKNGGGTTREITAFPPASGLNDFAWRVSMAKVETSGSFSIFPGVERTLTVLSGTMRLLAVGRDPIVLTPSSKPFEFPGDLGICARLIEGPVEDLNVMVRRGEFSASVTRIALNREITHEVSLRHTSICLCEEGPIEFGIANHDHCLEQGDSMIFDDANPATLLVRSPSDATLLLIRIEDIRQPS